VIWLYILVEGPTEENFVKLTLGPHLLNFSVHAIPIIVTFSRDPRTGEKARGGGSWKRWVTDLHCLAGQHSRQDARFTTLFDFYGLPRDFPERKAHLACADTVQCVRSLEQAMANIVEDRRFIPYLQRHEFEALVLACLDKLSELLDSADRPSVARLTRDLEGMGPEDVNGGEQTAPSKRLEKVLGYTKTLHGPFAIDAAGLVVIRSKCPGFDAWLTKLESLAGTTP